MDFLNRIYNSYSQPHEASEAIQVHRDLCHHAGAQFLEENWPIVRILIKILNRKTAPDCTLPHPATGITQQMVNDSGFFVSATLLNSEIHSCVVAKIVIASFTTQEAAR